MTVPARSPVDAALDRLGGLRATAESLGMAVATQWFADLATVCEALERQRELASHESDEIVHWREQFEAMSFERDAAEAEVRQLREERDQWKWVARETADNLHSTIRIREQRAEAAEAENRRLTEWGSG